MLPNSGIPSDWSILGSNGPKMPHYYLNFVIHLYGFRSSGNAPPRFAYGEFRGVSFKDGKASCVNNIHPTNYPTPTKWTPYF